MSKKIFAKLFYLAAVFCTAPTFANKIYNESKGIVIMEAENTDSALGQWQVKSELQGYKGSGYLHFTGNTHRGGKPKSRLNYHFKINNGGVYVIDVHSAKMSIDGKTDLAADFYIKLVGDFSSLPGRYDVPDSNASLNMLKTDTKYFGGKIDEWEWASGDAHAADISKGRLDPGGKTNKRQAVYQLKSGHVYTLVVHGRSKDFRVDRIVFRNIKSKADKNGPESGLTKASLPIPHDTDKFIKATSFDAESHPNTQDSIAKHKSSHVAAIQNNTWVRYDNFDFGQWQGGSIDMLASSRNAGGKIEIRTGSAEGMLIATVDIKHTWDWDVWTTFTTNVIPVRGKQPLYLVFKGKGSELFHLKEFIFRSGEYVIDKPQKPPVRPPAGRLAFVADGNSPDPDDIGATATALALLRVTGLDKRLVHLSHSCDLVKASNISAEDEKKRQVVLQETADGTRRLWGGFEGLTFWNCMTQQEATIADLTQAINMSTAADPLWIVEAGEPDIIGYALKRADPAKRKYVKMITHHPVNDRSGDFFTFKQMMAFGIELVRIPDQNGPTYAKIHEGLQRQLKAFHWAKDIGEPRYQWLWEQVAIAEEDNVVKFQKNKSDISDAGMVYYWITGADLNDGYESPSMYDVIDMFSAYDKKLKAPLINAN